MSIVLAWADSFLAGSLVILRVFAIALVLTIAWGLLGATAKLSGSRVARRLAANYTTVFRGIPPFVS